MMDIMIDLETLGIDYNSVFWSIGAVKFNLKTGEIKDKFYEIIDWQSSVEAGRTINVDTLKWWIKQSNHTELLKEGDSITNVLTDFSDWIPEGSCVWGNGATFDIAKLEIAYTQLNIPIPWDFWNIRDVRTAVDLLKINKEKYNFIGIKHNALDDALYQVKYLCGGYNEK